MKKLSIIVIIICLLSNVSIAQRSQQRKDIPEDVKAIFWEGVCVLAGHALLSAHGERGFVDAHPNCSDYEERIEAFSKTGAVVLSNYFENKAQEKQTHGKRC